jgi:hypothetical protein
MYKYRLTSATGMPRKSRDNAANQTYGFVSNALAGFAGSSLIPRLATGKFTDSSASFSVSFHNLLFGRQGSGRTCPSPPSP